MNRESLNEIEDIDLVSRYKSTGDMTALGVLFNRYSAMVFGVCLKYLKSPSDSEDAVMGIFEELIQKLRLHDIANFKSWLYVVTRHYCLQELRKKRIHLSDPDDPRIMHLADSAHHEDMMVLEHKEARLRECIKNLGEDQRKVIEYFYFAGASYKEIALQTGVDTEKVRSRIQNGRRNLKNCLESQNQSK